MKIVFDIDGWRKEEEFCGSILCGRVEIALYPPMSILVEKNGKVELGSKAVRAAFEYRGKHQGTLPIFEYTP